MMFTFKVSLRGLRMHGGACARAAYLYRTVTYSVGPPLDADSLYVEQVV